MQCSTLEQILEAVDRQIKASKAKLASGPDRRKEQKPLPEGMEDRRKLADRRKGRQSVREKEKEE